LRCFTAFKPTRRFVFSKPSSEPITSSHPVPNSYLDYLPKISPRSWAYDGQHHKLIADHLDAVTRGEIDRLAIFMPPRHGKTETVTIRYPVYRLEKDPTIRCLITGYNERIARKFSRRARNLAKPRIALSSDKTGVDEWESAAGGGVVARGVGTPPTGFGFNVILIDDPIKSRQEAESTTYRENVFDWYTDDLYTRLEPGGALILTLTRWHHDDLAARAIASEPSRWTILRLPALAEENDPIGRQPGAALWPERFNEEQLERIKSVQQRTDGAYSFEALYQQNPTPREGAFFKVSKIEIIDAAPTGLRMCRAWDLAASTDGDYTVGVKVGVDHMNNFVVLDVVRGRWLPDERDAVMKQTAGLDGKECVIHLVQDPGQAGVDQIKRLTKMLAGYRLRADRPTGSKEVRADGAASQVNVGNVKMLLNPKWNAAFIEELRTFPLGANDDIVDSFSDAITALTQPSKMGAVRY
jgi:predicted phage terminase large subunit-like protein